MEEKLSHRLREGRKLWGMLRNWTREDVISPEIQRRIYEKVVIPTGMYGSETWALCSREKENLVILRYV